MTVGPDGGEGGIVVGVDGSGHSLDALGWAAHFAAIFGARLDVVAAWEYPQSYGWAAIAPEWDPGQDMAKVLDDAVRAVFGDQQPASLQLQVREGVRPRCFSVRARVLSCWSSAAVATGVSPDFCWAR